MCRWTVLLVLMFFPPLTFTQEVSVNASGREGGGLLRARGSDCYAITADHVVQEATAITVTDGGHHQASVSLTKEYNSEDLAILSFDGHDRAMCNGSRWPSHTDGIGNLLKNAGANGKLVKLTAGGAVAQMPVTMTHIGDGQVIVRPTGDQNVIARGWSGSALEVNGSIVGILLSVDPSTMLGTVSRLDYVRAIVGPFFEPTDPDPFLDSVASPDFAIRVTSLLDLLVHNKLEAVKGEYQGDQKIEEKLFDNSYYSLVQLPGFGKPGLVHFWSHGCYTCRSHLDKHPTSLVYSQSFDDPIRVKNDLLERRFDALSDRIAALIPSWTRNSYHEPVNERRDEYVKNGMKVVLDSDGFHNLGLKFMPGL